MDDLLKRMKQFSYKPYPVRRAYIPKGNGKMRGLGIPSLRIRWYREYSRKFWRGYTNQSFWIFLWIPTQPKLS